MWNFDEIPASESAILKTAFRNNDYKTLKKAVKDYNIAPVGWCGSCDEKKTIKEWFNWAIHYDKF